MDIAAALLAAALVTPPERFAMLPFADAVPFLGALSMLSTEQLCWMALSMFLAWLGGGGASGPSPPHPWPELTTDPAEYSDAGLGALPAGAENGDLYLDAMKRSLTNVIYEDVPGWTYGADKTPRLAEAFDLRRRVAGEDAPTKAMTMVGVRRLENLQKLVGAIVADGVQGDIIETGVGRGGACIFLAAVLRSHGQLGNRRVFVADTFVGPQPPPGRIALLLLFPIMQLLGYIPLKSFQMSLFRLASKVNKSFPDAERIRDDAVRIVIFIFRNIGRFGPAYGTSLPAVKSNFARYGLLHPDAVIFLEGFFSDTIPKRKDLKQLSLIRADGDTYESTMQALLPLYDKLSVGGYVVIDDYNSFDDCKEAVTEFRADRKITSPLIPIDGLAVYWKKTE